MKVREIKEALKNANDDLEVEIDVEACRYPISDILVGKTIIVIQAE